MNKLKTVFKILFGFFLKRITNFSAPEKKLWVIGSGKGELYNENSKYLFEHILQNNQEIEIVWITKSKDVLNEMQSQNLPVLNNFSFKGIATVIRASVYFYSTVRTDVEYYFPNRRKKVVNLFHGMPIKKIIYDYDGVDLSSTFLVTRFYNRWVAGFIWENVDLHIASSDFFIQFLISAYRSSEKRIAITGLPRNDFFFSQSVDRGSDLVASLDGRFVISYLPTHRKFGKGIVSPIPFLDNEDVQKYFVEHKIVFVYKAHYNEASNVGEPNNGCILNYSNEKIDTQELLKSTDLLVSDYSSCIIDFLIQDRPVIGYFYDDYKTADTGLYFDIEDEALCPGQIARSEQELFLRLKEVFENGDPAEERRKFWISKYHQDRDGKSSERVVASVKNLLLEQ